MNSSDTTTATAGMTFTMPEYVCPLGHRSSGRISDTTTDVQRDYCIVCYGEWLEENIPRAQRVQAEPKGFFGPKVDIFDTCVGNKNGHEWDDIILSSRHGTLSILL